jgi:hypothetical protein
VNGWAYILAIVYSLYYGCQISDEGGKQFGTGAKFFEPRPWRALYVLAKLNGQLPTDTE